MSKKVTHKPKTNILVKTKLAGKCKPSEPKNNSTLYTERPVFLAVTGLSLCLKLPENLFKIPIQNSVKKSHKKSPKRAIFFMQNMLVELPDTASGSEKSPGYHSTCVVLCFNLGLYYQLQITKLTAAMTSFSSHLLSIR